MTAGVVLKPGAAFTMPKTRSHATTRSRSPSSRFKLASAESAVDRAAAYACSSVTSAPTLPSGCASDPSGFCGPWPAMNARLPRTRTFANGSTTPGGGANGCGNASPNSSSFASMCIGLSLLYQLNTFRHRSIQKCRYLAQQQIREEDGVVVGVGNLYVATASDDAVHALGLIGGEDEATIRRDRA